MFRRSICRAIRQHRFRVYRSTICNFSSEGSSIPASADVVVIGGGSLGCNVLYSLTKMGVTNTVLLEAHKLTSGTTWHTAGLVWRLRPSDVEVQLLSSTRCLLERLEEETGVYPGWINNGGLFIASSKVRMQEYRRLRTLGKVLGIESQELSPQETKNLYPLMNVEDIYATLYSQGDGVVDPAGLCNGLTRYASREGAGVFEDCPVTGITTSKSLLGGTRIEEVHTSSGSIKTNCIVNATGCWANDIANLVGIHVPLVAMKHAYAVTEKIPGIENMPNVRDHDASIYMRLQGDALCIGGYENNPILLEEGVGKDSAFGLYELDWDVYGTHLLKGINRVPILEKTGIKSTICGPESFTPDHKPIMGEDPNVEGFFHCCGFNSAGMMLGGGCGEQLAKWIVQGRPELDMFGYDVRRFPGSFGSKKDCVMAKSHEAYAKNYSIVFPHDEPLAGRNQKKSPLHNVLEESGCVFQERHDWERPGWFNTTVTSVQPYDWYGAYDTVPNEDEQYKAALFADYSFDFPTHHNSIRDECVTCRTKAAIFDMSYFGKFYLRGPDAEKAANWLFTANVNRKPGSVVYTCMLNKHGGVEADLTVSGEGGACDPKFEGKCYYLAVGGAVAMQNWAHVLKEIRMNKWVVSLDDRSENMALMSLQGPQSREILQSLTSTDLSNQSFPFSTHKIITVAGHKVRALRLSFVGEMGWELHVPSEYTIAVYKAVVEAGKPFGLINSGYRAIDSLSCEKGYRHWHADLRTDDSPLEAGLGFCCKLKSDTPFLGRDVLERQKSEGLRKKLVTITVNDTEVPLWGLEAIKMNGTILGHVRRAEYAFTLGRTIAYSYVSHPDGSVITNDFLKSGSWSVESMDVEYPVTLHLQHPFDPKNLRIMGHYDKINVPS